MTMVTMEHSIVLHSRALFCRCAVTVYTRCRVRYIVGHGTRVYTYFYQNVPLPLETTLAHSGLRSAHLYRAARSSDYLLPSFSSTPNSIRLSLCRSIITPPIPSSSNFLTILHSLPSPPHYTRRTCAKRFDGQYSTTTHVVFSVDQTSDRKFHAPTHPRSNGLYLPGTKRIKRCLSRSPTHVIPPLNAFASYVIHVHIRM